MRLRTQLLLVSLLTLALPWAGCQYVREMERAQRQGVEDGLLANATIVASALAARPELLYPYLEVRTATRDPGADVYATASMTRRCSTVTPTTGSSASAVPRAGTTRPRSRVEYVAPVDRSLPQSLRSRATTLSSGSIPRSATSRPRSRDRRIRGTGRLRAALSSSPPPHPAP
jgi:hypothetical protein